VLLNRDHKADDLPTTAALWSRYPCYP
jgi:hypothetical protein